MIQYSTRIWIVDLVRSILDHIKSRIHSLLYHNECERWLIVLGDGCTSLLQLCQFIFLHHFQLTITDAITAEKEFA